MDNFLVLMTVGKLRSIYNSGLVQVQGLARVRWSEPMKIAILLESVFYPDLA